VRSAELAAGPGGVRAGSLRVGVADSVDPRDMSAGSGVSASLLLALEELGADAVPLSGGLPPLVGRVAHLSSVASRLRPSDLGDLRAAAKSVHGAAKLGRPTVAARTMLMRRRVAAAGRLDGLIQRGSELRLQPGRGFVTYDDSTVVQARAAYPWPHLQGMSDADFAHYAERQRRIFGAAIACCCATHWVADSVVSDYGIDRGRVFTVGLGQNHELPLPESRDWSTPHYLFVGSDWTRKNGAAVVAAFARVRERHPEARLDLVGDHPAIDAPGVATHGPLSLVSPADRGRMTALYGQATAFVMPSLHEPAGIVHVEAGSAGIGSVGTRDGGAATMIGPGGILVDPRDPGQLLEAMLALADAETARRMGELAHGHAAHFTWPKVAERLLRAMAIPGLETDGFADFL
jgi:glycosyltransferase involved in cell wall biosynthesis